MKDNEASKALKKKIFLFVFPSHGLQHESCMQKVFGGRHGNLLPPTPTPPRL